MGKKQNPVSKKDARYAKSVKRKIKRTAIPVKAAQRKVVRATNRNEAATKRFQKRYKKKGSSADMGRVMKTADAKKKAESKLNKKVNERVGKVKRISMTGKKRVTKKKK